MTNKPALPVKIIISIIACIGLGAIGSIATSSSIDTWYTTINKPSFNPPSWLFAPVWTILFALMGLAAAYVWDKGLDRKAVRSALILFGIQFLLNIAWSFLFFGAQNPTLAFIEILILWVFIFLTIRAFFKIKKLSGWLLVPYLLWVSFASILNFSIMMLN